MKKSRFTTYYYKRRGSGRCLGCSSAEEIGTDVYCSVCKKKRSEGAQKRNQILKQTVIEHYGNKCAWVGCDVADLDMLSIDHIENDGAQEKKVYRSAGFNFYRYVIKNGFPEGKYQVLCFNHQWKKRMMSLRNEKLPVVTKKAVA
jgi:hypothetical protein